MAREREGRETAEAEAARAKKRIAELEKRQANMAAGPSQT
jgi:hypothetical protein